jgi:beta-lactam-binding protein with PASTA domain
MIRTATLVVLVGCVAGALATTSSSARPHVVVPKVTGLTSQAAGHRLVSIGLHVRVHLVVSTLPAGTVLAQSPRARAVVLRGVTVRLTVAKAPVQAGGKTQVTVPDLVGLEKDAAAQRLQDAGLDANVDYVNSLQLVGTVVVQSPAAGSMVDSGSAVTISISRGPGP